VGLWVLCWVGVWVGVPGWLGGAVVSRQWRGRVGASGRGRAVLVGLLAVLGGAGSWSSWQGCRMRLGAVLTGIGLPRFRSAAPCREGLVGRGVEVKGRGC
jgi:hypothetical protein